MLRVSIASMVKAELMPGVDSRAKRLLSCTSMDDTSAAFLSAFLLQRSTLE